MDDIMIIDLFFSRNERAIRELETKYGYEMKRFTNRYLKDNRDIEEVYNDTLVDIWNSIPPDHPQKLRAYVMKILERKAINKLRYLGQKKRRQSEEMLFSEFDDIFFYLDERVMIKSAEDVVVDSKENIIAEFLENETIDNRRIFIKRYYYGKSMSEIAREHRIMESGVYSRLSRIRKRLYEFLQKKGVL